jgi:hypothetical protein
MSDNDDQNDEGIYRADTVPPPDGGDDAYNAPTRVGPMAATVVNEMIVAAQARESSSKNKPPPAAGAPPPGGDGGVLDDRDIEAELDPTGFPPPQRKSGVPSFRTLPPPVFSTPPAPASPSAAPPPVYSNTPPAYSHAPPAPPAFQGALQAPVNRTASTRLPLVVIACAGVAAVLMALAYGVVVTLGGR